jgi:hypothetical protein
MSAPGVPWNVEQIRQALAPKAPPVLELAELKPEWNSYDGLLSAQPEVAYAS